MVHFNLNSFLRALSTMLDFVEMDLVGVTSNHGRRVAYIAARLARQAGLPDAQVFDVVALSLLHDNGLSEEMLTMPASVAGDVKIRQAEKFVGHCEIGERNATAFPFLTDVSGVIRHHHERHDGGGYFGLTGEEIPFLSRLVGMADSVDLMFAFGSPDPANRDRILRHLADARGRQLCPRSCDLFFEIADKPAFWLDLQDGFIETALTEQTPDIWQDLPWDRVLDICRVFSRIVDCKSHFTERHSSGLEEKAARMAAFYGFDAETATKLRIAASLHDVGKLAIPNAILDKPGPLTAAEFGRMQEHTYYTRRCLEQVRGFGDITDWAANHHERLTGVGYPLGLAADDLDAKARLIACLDVYQALIEERPYRKALSHRHAMDILEAQARDGLLDAAIVADIDAAFAVPAADVGGDAGAIVRKRRSSGVTTGGPE